MLNVEKRVVDPDVAVFALAGKLTLGRDCQRVEWLVDDLLREGKPSVIFDFSGLTFIDSAGVGIVVMCYGKIKKAGGRLVLAGATGYVENTFKMTHVNQVIQMLPNVEAAAASFATPPSGRADSPPGSGTEPPAR